MTRKHFRIFVFYPCAVLIALVTLIWIITPYVVKHYLSAYIEEQGQALSIDKLSIDFFPPKVELKNVSISQNGLQNLTLKHAVFGIEAFPLFTKTIAVSDAIIDGLTLSAEQDKNDWIIAGINTAQFSANSESESTATEPEKQPTQEPSQPWKVSLPALSFTNSQLHWSRESETEQAQKSDQKIVSDTFTIESFTLNDVSGSELDWKGKVAISAFVNDASIGLKSQFSYSPETTNVTVTIENTNLPINSFYHFLPAPYNDGKGSVSLIGKLQFQQEESNGETTYKLNNLELNTKINNLDIKLDEQRQLATTLTELDITQADLTYSGQQTDVAATIKTITQQTLFTQTDGKQASIDNAEISIETLNLRLADKQEPSINANNINFSSQGLDIKLADDKRVASWANAGFTELNVSAQGDKFDAKLAELTISDLTISEALNTKPSLLPLTTIGNIKVTHVEANQEGASIKSISTDSMTASLFLDANKNLKNLVFISEENKSIPEASLANNSVPTAKDAQQARETTNSSEQEPAFKAPYYVVLDNYDMTGKSSIYVEDTSIVPALKHTLNIDKLSLRNLNTKDKNQAAVFTLEARNGKYSTIKNNVTIWPLADKLTMKSTLVIKEAELPPYSAYIADALGYQIDSGQLNLNLTLNADKGELSGNSHILLKEFDLGGHQESNAVVQSGVVPLNIAVSVLKDSDDNIDLDIPLSGNVESPEFGWQNFLLLPVRKALYSASSTYLMQTFVPYANVISVVQFAGNQLLKVRVEPLLFLPEDANLNMQQTGFLEQLTALMKDKSESQLKACGIVSYLDFGLTETPNSLSDANQSKGIELAKQRSELLKDYLVKSGISSSRIFLCAPEIDLSRSSKPRVELNF